MRRASGRQSSATPAHFLELRSRLREIYAKVDALFAGFSCEASTDCCRFNVTGREPYPTAIEVAELQHALRARGGLPKRRSLPVLATAHAERRCAFLSDAGRCLVYEARPFGCRTFFCGRSRVPAGELDPAFPRAEIASLARAVAELSAVFAPSDPGARPLSNVTAAWMPDPRPRRR